MTQSLSVLAPLAVALLLAGMPAAGARAQALPPLPPPVGQPPPQQPPPSQQQPPPQQGGGSQPAPSAPGPVSPAPGSISVGVDVAHTGFYPDDELVPPLVARWAVKSAARSVLAAYGRVYVVGDGVAALDQRDGHQLWAAPLDRPQGAAYDQGILFVTTFDDLFAFSADSGALLWTRHLWNAVQASPPVASGGVVYTYYDDGGGWAQAFRASDGTQLWKKNVVEGAGVPALDGDRIYYGAGCGNAEAVNRADGNRVWVHTSGCEGAGDHVTPALFGGRLYVPGRELSGGAWLDPPVLDAANGNLLGRFWASVFVDGLAVTSSAERSQAVDAATGRPAWSVRAPQFTSVAVGHDIFGIRQTSPYGERLTSLDAEKGGVIWSQQLADTLPNSGDPGVPGLAVAPGLLLVSTSKSLIAFESALNPQPGAIALQEADATSGSRTSVTGLLGRDLRPARPGVRIDVGPWHGGTFRRYEDVRPLRDGGFVTEIVPFRNLRLRASASGVTSAPAPLYVYPRIRLARTRRHGNRIQEDVIVTSPRVRLAGRRLVMYLDRGGRAPLTRLGAAALRGDGQGRATATVNLRTPRHLHRSDRLFSCIPGQLRLGLGQPSPLLRNCGKRLLHG